MKSGDKVECIDDQGWLIDGDMDSPVKGNIYVVKEFDYEGGVACVSLIGFPDDFFYRACRFKPLATVKTEDHKEEEWQSPKSRKR